jgi:hypothetical protein
MNWNITRTISKVLFVKVPHHHHQKQQTRRIVSSGMLRRAALVGTDVSEERSSSFIRVTRIGELGTRLAVIPWYFFAACVGC